MSRIVRQERERSPRAAPFVPAIKFPITPPSNDRDHEQEQAEKRILEANRRGHEATKEAGPAGSGVGVARGPPS